MAIRWITVLVLALVLATTAPAAKWAGGCPKAKMKLNRVGRKRVWLPREHIKGTLCCQGDIGRLLVRRWVAVDRKLILPTAPAVAPRICRPLRVLRPGRIPTGKST